MEFCRQEYWSGLPFPSRGTLPDPGTELGSTTLQADSLPSKLLGKPSKIVFNLNSKQPQGVTRFPPQVSHPHATVMC